MTLHDGAQQRLLTVSYELQLALADARSQGDEEAVSLLTRANTEAVLALAELRELAHGIFPAILADAASVRHCGPSRRVLPSPSTSSTWSTDASTPRPRTPRTSS